MFYIILIEFADLYPSLCGLLLEVVLGFCYISFSDIVCGGWKFFVKNNSQEFILVNYQNFCSV